MIGIIFIILCAGLLVKDHAGELLRKAIEVFPDAVLLSTEHRALGTNHYLLNSTKQKFGAQALLPALNLTHQARHFPLRLAQWNGLLPTPKVYILNQERFKLYIQDLLFRPPEKPYKSMKGGVDSTPRV